MNPGDQRILAKAKAEKTLSEREVQLKSKLDMVTYMLNRHIHGLDGVQIEESLVLVKDLVELQASRKAVLAELAALGD